MARCPNIQTATQVGIINESAVEEARRWNEGFRRLETEYHDSDGKDFGYPNPFDPGTPEYDGYREAVIAYQDQGGDE